ncbi:hypothetical protein HPB51_020466 [Rhipicephalus microplus]|uniref:Leucine--tRNA ligase n=1 Tax=Rhipicephalus microplus TaxID=6941 RepID=A0A9J6DC39_RHIMP|nr:hypothetical protein HPB51_020466 [Rhipicephalus microplus]
MATPSESTCQELPCPRWRHTLRKFARTFSTPWTGSARTYGLGTKLPWDESWLLESLSDSTIYMAYYTVAHYLQGGDLVGGSACPPYFIKPEDMMPEAWDYVFLNVASKTKLQKKDALNAMKKELEFWYPMNLRCSGKDLIPNHLSYCIFNHCAMWPENPEKWVLGMRANGHLLLNSEKMFKSTGNFLTLADALDKFSADGMRLALADAGDVIEDANFVGTMANAGILCLYTFLEWVKEMLASLSSLHTGPTDSYVDRAFEADMSHDNKVVSARLKDKPELKKHMKKGMPFAQAVREKIEKLGIGALNVTLDFDEREVLLENLRYILNTLEVDDIEFKFSDNPTTEEVVREECCPGQPRAVFCSDTFVNVCCINQQQSSGCFEVQVPVLDGDSASKVLARLARVSSHVSFDGLPVKLLRYEDPTMGPRKIPTSDCEETGKVVVPNEAIFRIKGDKSGVEVELDGT